MNLVIMTIAMVCALFGMYLWAKPDTGFAINANSIGFTVLIISIMIYIIGITREADKSDKCFQILNEQHIINPNCEYMYDKYEIGNYKKNTKGQKQWK